MGDGAIFQYSSIVLFQYYPCIIYTIFNIFSIMSYHNLKHNRKSIRLPGWDYTLPGRYFITICVKGGVCYFGKIINGKMNVNKYGGVVEREWLEIEKNRSNIKLDKHVVMPNHFHGIIIITHRIKPPNPPEEDINNLTRSGRVFRLKANSIGSIVGQFKSDVTKQIEKILENEPITTPYFSWQRNYNDHIIRTEKELKNIRNYIRDNPKNWNDDEFNPLNWKE